LHRTPDPAAAVNEDLRMSTHATTSTRLLPIAPAWARNSVNAVVFRNDPISTVGDEQSSAFYDADGRVLVARQRLDSSHWSVTATSLAGNVRDAHNCISLIADGDGFLHISWDHHGHPLRYARGDASGCVDLRPRPMTGAHESNVTYPQFFCLPSGDLLSFYRDGASGNGNLVLNRYDTKAQRWTQLHANLISGVGQRNAYWQCCVGAGGSIHVSWVWRESPDVCYAVSRDGGHTWTRSAGAPCALPITLATANVAWAVQQRSELINQTSMRANALGRPIVATYFRPA
jgi:hypothetical protein